MIQKLRGQNVPPSHIMQVSGHKNVHAKHKQLQLPIRSTTARYIKYSCCFGANQFSYRQGNIQQDDRGRTARNRGNVDTSTYSNISWSTIQWRHI